MGNRQHADDRPAASGAAAASTASGGARPGGPRPSGLRAHKRQDTRDRIVRAALSRFRARGFDGTTVEQIAADAGVAPRTFFHHFATKEDVVFGWQDELRTALLDALAQRPAGEAITRSAESAVVAAAGHFERSEAAALSRMIRDTPALRARNGERFADLEHRLAVGLTARLDGASDDAAAGLRPRLVAMLAIGALRVAADTWLTAGQPTAAPAEHVQRVFAALWRECAAHAAPPTAP